MVDDFLKRIVIFFGFGLHTQHHIAKHLNEATVGVPCKTLVAGFAGQTFHSLVVQTKVEHGVHHTGHRSARAGANRHQAGIVGIGKACSHYLFHFAHRFFNLILDQRHHVVASFLVVEGAHFGGDGEPGRHGHANKVHLGQVGAFATQQVFHRGISVGFTIAEEVNILGFSHC